MKTKGKIFSLLTTILCLVPLFVGLLGMGEEASAAIEKVNVTLHKKKMDEFPTGGVQNTGEVMSEFNNYDPLPGVEFTVYDITNAFYTALNAELTGNESTEEYAAKVKETMNSFTSAPAGAAEVGKDTTNSQGNVTFSDLNDRDANGRYNVYLFIETNNPDYTQFSQPLVMMLPLKGKEGNTLTDIHLYPKNKVKNDLTKELIDENGTALGKDLHSYDVGKEIHYRATYVIPSQIGEIIKNADGSEQTRYSQLIFKDTMSKDGIEFKQIDKIVIDGNVLTEAQFKEFTETNATTTYVNKGSDYSAAGKKAGFEITTGLNASTSLSNSDEYAKSKAVAEYLSQYSGKKVEIFYSVAFTEDTEVDVRIGNDFSVIVKQTTDTEAKTEKPDKTPEVITGGKKFMKHEAGKEDQGLAGAEFAVIKKADGKEYYLAPGAGNRNWVEVGANENYSGARKLTSGADGTFEIAGLEFGDYSLREVKAPDGFQKLAGDVDFTIDEGSYKGTTAVVQKIANTPRGGFLPSTGGKGIIAFLLVGFSLMAFAVTRYRKAHKQMA